MKRSFFIKYIFSFTFAAFVALLACCKQSDYFTLSEDEQYLTNLKLGILDTPALTVQRLPQKIYFSSSTVQDGFYLYDFEILCVPQENQRTIKFRDEYTMVFKAEVQSFAGEKIDAKVKALKIVADQKEIPLEIPKTVNVIDGRFNFAQDIPLKDEARGLNNFSVVATLQTTSPKRIVLVTSGTALEHFTSKNIQVEYVEKQIANVGDKTVTLTFKNNDGSVFQTLTGKPFEEIDPPVLNIPSHKFIAWQGLPALFPQEDASYEPILEIAKYAITYMLDGGVNSKGNPDYYTVETPSFYFYPAAKDGYVFEGWYKERIFKTRVTRFENGITEDIVLYAKFSLPAIGAISLNKNQLTLNAGQTEQLEATLILQDGSTQSVMWTSNNEDVVVVDEEGNVTALNVEKESTAVVTASYSDLTASCKITVIPVK